ncbi:hypothetical protein GF373_12855, partial [bacterium]|nr:hypothetical protein [bacterium]
MKQSYLPLLIICIFCSINIASADPDWPVLKTYDQDHLVNIGLPLGGIGTGTVSLGGRGHLHDWELMNHPAKGFTPQGGGCAPFFALYAKPENGEAVVRCLEGPIDESLFEESHGSTAQNHGLPRFRRASFAAAYPLGQIMLADEDVPLRVRLEAFNPMVPADADKSGLPVAVLRFVLINPTGNDIDATVCGTLPNFIGIDGWKTGTDWKGDTVFIGGKENRNHYREGDHIKGIFMNSEGVEEHIPAWGTLALTTTSADNITYRTAWSAGRWGTALLDFWDDLSDDGKLEERRHTPD